MAKASTLSFLAMVVLIICSLQGDGFKADAATGGSGPARRLLADIITTACDGNYCTQEFYNTSYVTCKSNEGETFPAYSNCCVLRSCLPDVSMCTLHLNNDEGSVDCTF